MGASISLIAETEISPVEDTGDFSYVYIPGDLVEKTERKIQQRQKARAKYDTKRPHRDRSVKPQHLPFIFWDGEAPKDVGYCLFGSSMGDILCDRRVLGTQEMFDLLLERATKTNGIHCWYGGNYDVSNILKDIGWRKLNQLKDHNKTIWRGYVIQYIPRKWLSIKYGHVVIRVYDVVSFFGGTFKKALKDFEIGSAEQQAYISSMKDDRPEFTWNDIEEIKKYWRLELELGVLLMNKLRSTFHDAGFYPTKWYGPGALATMALRRHNVKAAMAKSPKEVRTAALFAFAGGRFEMTHGGYIAERIYNADINSAYPHFARYLPNLARGQWRYTNHYESGKFGVYHIDYNYTGARDIHRIFPLFDRRTNGTVVWPENVEGWYWNPEAELVKGDKDARIIEGWVFDEDDENDKPFAWLLEYYQKRQTLKRLGNPAEFTFKLIINSVYGQLAQRTGWNKRTREAPSYHQLEWAGYITSACRALIYSVASSIRPELLVSIDTDGIYAREPLPVVPSTDLGGWEVTTYTAGLFWQSGIYCLATDEGWQKGKTKTRGIRKGEYTFELMKECYDKGLSLELTRSRFIGFGLALNGQFDKLNTWTKEHPKFAFGGGDGLAGSKRYHHKHRCARECDGNVHVFRLGMFRPGMSHVHRLPWLTELDSRVLNHDDYVRFDQNDLDEEEALVLGMIDPTEYIVP